MCDIIMWYINTYKTASKADVEARANTAVRTEIDPPDACVVQANRLISLKQSRDDNSALVLLSSLSQYCEPHIVCLLTH